MIQSWGESQVFAESLSLEKSSQERHQPDGQLTVQSLLSIKEYKHEAMKRLVLCVIAFGWTLNQQSGPEIRTDLFKRSIISKCGYICCSSLYILFNEKITFSAMLFTRILLGLELDHLLAHLAVLEQQHLPDCQERSLGRKSWRKLVLVATKRRREAIKRNFSQPASLTSYSGENFGADILLTAAGQNWAN